MKIGIIGSGIVAQTLGAGLVAHGHQVMLGTRDPAKLAAFVAGHPGIQVDGVAQAAAFAELAILAVKGTGALEAARAAAAGFAGKTVIDTTNPIKEEAPVDGVLGFFTGPNDSLMEQLQREFKAIRFVKAFNSVGSASMIDPKFAGGPPTMFIAGDDAQARAQVAQLLAEVGWDVEDLGKAVAARAIEPLAILWCIPGFLRNDWVHAYKMLR
jgi:predicted dinucleotide-binding enzyme